MGIERADGDPLDLLDPLLGDWTAEGESPVGPYVCRRSFRKVLAGAFVQLDTHWEYATAPFHERTLFGRDEDNRLQFWSFGSDGEQFGGRLLAQGGLSEQAMVFESLMPAGRMRMSYWPMGVNGVVVFIVESQSRQGWKRILEHHYRRSQ